MTKKDFKEAMMRGLGRCVIALQEEPERHRDTVLWACTRNIAYDAQCEGTRAWYVYTLACCYPDREPFIRAAAEALKAYRPNGGWDLLHLSELLMCFAGDGEEAARQAVEEKYQELLAAMRARKRRPNRLFHELADLEQLGLTLASDYTATRRVAADFGRLYKEAPYLTDGDFPWFFAAKEAAVTRAAKENADVARFLQRERAANAALAERARERRATDPAALSGIPLSRWLARQGDEETTARYARAYRAESDPAARATALAAFALCPYPDDPAPVIADTQSSCEALQEAAWRALEHICHPAVREFALKKAAGGVHTSENFALLATNYQPADGALLESLLREWIAAKDWDRVHTAGMDIFRIFDNARGIPRPRHLLPLLYTYTPCSFCRESAVRFMAKHRVLTEDVLEECLYDSNDAIRRYAAKRSKT